MGIMAIFKSTKAKFSSEQVETIVMRNNAKTFIIGGRFTKLPNSLRDYWNLYVYEIHQGSIEIEFIKQGLVGQSRTNSIGYLCDEIGTTINPERIVTKSETKDPAAEEFKVSKSWLDDFEFKRQSVRVPYILISQDGKKWTAGGYIRKAGKILTNGINPVNGEIGPAYRIASDPVEIINIQTGEKGMGYLCDETGQTVSLVRDIKAWMPDPIRKRKMSDGDECDLQQIAVADKDRIIIKGNFAGIMGQIAGIDKIQEFFDFGNASMTKWKFFGIGVACMGGLWMVFR
jgi:hypothetical protein